MLRTLSKLAELSNMERLGAPIEKILTSPIKYLNHPNIPACNYNTTFLAVGVIKAKPSLARLANWNWALQDSIIRRLFTTGCCLETEQKYGLIAWARKQPIRFKTDVLSSIICVHLDIKFFKNL